MLRLGRKNANTNRNRVIERASVGITLNSFVEGGGISEGGEGDAWNNLCGPRIRFRVIRGGEEERVSAEIFNHHSTNFAGTNLQAARHRPRLQLTLLSLRARVAQCLSD